VWYQITPTSDAIGVATISNQAFRAQVSVFSGACGSLSCIYTSSYSSYSDRTVTWPAVTGTDYYIAVSGDDFFDKGIFDITVEVSQAFPFLLI
jgi:hypothetical protein